MSETNEKIDTGKFRGIFGFAVTLAAGLLLLWGGYMWFFCRFFVPPVHMAVVTAKTGTAPKAGTILVERGEKGIWREVLAEGRHFLDPIRYEVKIVPATVIPLGKVGVVTSKIGRELPPGEIIAPDESYKGVRRDVLGPGVYRFNPEGYKIDLADAINIPAGYVGVVTSQTGKAPKFGEFASPGEKGVFRDILQPGLYYLNRYAYQVNVIEIGMNQVTMSSSSEPTSVVQLRNQVVSYNKALQEMAANTLNFQQELRKRKMNISADSAPAAVTSKRMRGARQSSSRPEAAKAAPAEAQIFGVSRAVEFPSRDGFKVVLTMTVEFELMPENIARIYLLYGDLPQVVEKIILPQVLSVSRLKGSSYRGQEFIMGDGREKFQLDLRNELEKVLESKKIIVHNAIIRNVEIPLDILTPIRAVSLAREQDLTNVALQETARKLAELNTETELIDQRRREVEQETRKLVAGISAEQNKEVAEINAETLYKVAQLNLQRSEVLAKTAKLKGETGVRVKFLVDNEKAAGDLLKAGVLGGGAPLARLSLIEAINPEVKTRIIHAGEGTLWTDLKGGAVTLPAKK